MVTKTEIIATTDCIYVKETHQYVLVYLVQQYKTLNEKQETWSRLDFLFGNGCVVH